MNKKNGFGLSLFVYLISISMHSQAAAAPPMTADSVVSIIQLAMAPAVNLLLAQAMTWLGAFAGLQFFITNFKLLIKGSDMQEVLAKLAGSLAWIGVCIYFIENGPAFIGSVGHQLFGMLGISLPNPGTIIASTLGIVGVLAAAAAGVGAPIIGSTTIGMLIVYLLLFIFGVGMFFAIKIFMIQLELGLVIMLAPMSFAFLGLDALKDQGIAPFKALISLGYRILLMTIILSAFSQVSDVVSATLGNIKPGDILGGIGNFLNAILGAVGAYIMLGYLLYKSDSIASSLASGGTNMGTGDVASAAAAGAAAGAAIGSGGAKVAGGAAKLKSAIPDSVKSMMGGGGGSMQNESRGSGAAGRGGLDQKAVGTAPTKPETPVASLGKNGYPEPPPPKATPPVAGGDNAAPPSGEGGGSNAIHNSANSMEPMPSADVATASSGPSGSPPNPPAGGGGGPGSSGTSAGIEGASTTDQKLDKLLETMGQTQKPALGDHLKTLNDHVSRESTATHVSINANAGD